VHICTLPSPHFLTLPCVPMPRTQKKKASTHSNNQPREDNVVYSNPTDDPDPKEGDDGTLATNTAVAVTRPIAKVSQPSECEPLSNIVSLTQTREGLKRTLSQTESPIPLSSGNGSNIPKHARRKGQCIIWSNVQAYSPLLQVPIKVPQCRLACLRRMPCQTQKRA